MSLYFSDYRNLFCRISTVVFPLYERLLYNLLHSTQRKRIRKKLQIGTILAIRRYVETLTEEIAGDHKQLFIKLLAQGFLDLINYDRMAFYDCVAFNLPKYS